MFKQKYKKIVNTTLISSLLVFGAAFVLSVPVVQAQTFEEIDRICSERFPIESDPSSVGYNECRTRMQQERSQQSTGGGSAAADDGEYKGLEADCTIDSTANNCGITRYLVIFINVLSVLAGIVIAGSIAYGGILYSMSGSDPQKVSAAKERIRNAIIALLFFLFGYGFINYLIPGGLL